MARKYVKKALKPTEIKPIKAAKAKPKKKAKKTKMSKAEREQKLKIKKLENAIKRGAKKLKYGKKVFKNSETAKKYLETMRLRRLLKEDPISKKALVDINKLNVKLKKKAKSEDLKNLRSLFPKGIKFDPSWTAEQVRDYINEVLAKAVSLSDHEIFAKIQSFFSAVSPNIDGYKIAKALSEIPMDNEDREALRDLLDGLYLISKDSTLSPEEKIHQMNLAIDAFLENYQNKYPNEDISIQAEEIRNELEALTADFE